MVTCTLLRVVGKGTVEAPTPLVGPKLLPKMEISDPGAAPRVAVKLAAFTMPPLGMVGPGSTVKLTVNVTGFSDPGELIVTVAEICPAGSPCGFTPATSIAGVTPELGVKVSHADAGDTTALQEMLPPAPLLLRFTVTGAGDGLPAMIWKATLG